MGNGNPLTQRFAVRFAVRRLTERDVVRSEDEESRRQRRFGGGNGWTGDDLVHQKELSQEHVRPLPRAEPVP